MKMYMMESSSMDYDMEKVIIDIMVDWSWKLYIYIYYVQYSSMHDNI
jgi:hypothetical protein